MLSKNAHFLLLLLALLLPSRVRAADLSLPGGQTIPYPAQTNPVFDFSGDLGTLTSKLLPYIFVLAGILMLAYLIYGGFQLMISAGDPKGIQEGKGKIVNAIVGFIVIFAAYWLVQILQVVFHLSVVTPI